LEAGKHVVCEKPFSMDAAQARLMHDRATSAGLVALVGHEFRFAPERALMARLLGGGVIGEPRVATLVSCIDLVADPEARLAPWWFDGAQGGGWLGASGSHVVDQLLTWLGEIAWLSATTTVVSDRGPDAAEDTFTISMGFRSGAVGVAQQSAGVYGPGAGITRVAGSHGTLWLEGSDVWLADRAGSRRITVPADLVLPAVMPSDDPRHRFSHLELGPYTRLAQTLRVAIGGSPLPTNPGPASFADGVACMDVLDAVRRSASERGTRVSVAD
ncbi:MAG: Gfo/Idh/MocA family protein, partial [Acidimicrobiales bacterium]